MADILSTGVSGLLAFQRALDVTSNNVANVSTPGYSVQTANMTEQQPTPTALGYIGSGVSVTSITRAYDEALTQQVRTSQSDHSSANTFATLAAQIDNLLSNSGTGLPAALQSFANALQTVANSPSSTAQRQVLLSQAQALTQQLQSYDAQMARSRGNLEAQLGTNIAQVNSLASSIASLNTQIAAGIAGTGQTPNSLLDQRDQLIDKLSQYVKVSTSSQSDGQTNVYIGNGQALVNAGTAQALSTVAGPYDPTRQEIAIQSGGVTSVITTQITGGVLGGLLAARTQVLDKAQNAVGQLSVGLTQLMNQQQAAGMDLNGALGSPMFAVGGPQSLPAAANTGTAAVNTTITSLAALTTDDYRLQMTGGSWQLTDITTGQAVALSGNGTAASPLQAVGLSMVVTGAAANGDSFQIRPTAGATAGLSVLLTSPNQIAAAAPIQTTTASSNAGNATISSGSVVNAGNPQLLTTASLQFTSPTTYQINGAGSFPYTSGAPIAANGWSVTITGTPATGDTFTVSANSNGTGDNRNALAMVGALSSAALNGGTTSLSGAANNLVSQIGVVTQQAQSTAAVQHGLYREAVTARNNVAGVNLDEEAAKLLRYQQAYQACAQVIQTSHALFNSLLSAVRGG